MELNGYSANTQFYIPSYRMHNYVLAAYIPVQGVVYFLFDCQTIIRLLFVSVAEILILLGDVHM